jgi:hypothetical protein
MAKAEAVLDATPEVVDSQVSPEPVEAPAPPTEDLINKVVKVKNVSRNVLSGLDGPIEVGSEGTITFQDFCNLSPTYVTEVVV